MKKTVLILLLSAIIMAAGSSCADGSAEKGETNRCVSADEAYVYIERIGGVYYHYDNCCKMACELNFPMVAKAKDEIKDGLCENKRPCPICAKDDSDAFMKAAERHEEKKTVERMKREDEINIKLMDRDELDFEDWAELFPGSYAVPDKNDISKDTAAEIALNIVSVQFDESRDDIYVFEICCFPDRKFNGEDQKIYLVQIGNVDYPLLYNVELTTKHGEIICVKKLIN